MAQLILNDMSPEKLVRIADALMRMGDANTARELYIKALGNIANASPPMQSRVGMTRVAARRRAPMQDALDDLQRIDPQNAFVGEGLATWFKDPPFGSDQRFMRLAEEHAGLLPTASWHWNLQTVVWAVQQARALEGEFVELGVFKGHTTRFVADYVGFGDWRQTWHLYDTFEGIPEDQLDEGWASNNKAAYHGTFSVEEVRARFESYANIKIIQGRVPEILAEGCPDKISFLHMDLNNVTAEIAALDALFDRIVPGGIIVFDDYCWSVSHAQRVAEDAWMAKRGAKILGLPTGQGLFVKAA